jgi:sulfur carrier protein
MPMIRVTVNGREQKLDRPVDVATLLKMLNVNPRLVAVGYNGEVLNKEHLQELLLKDGDSLDIVHMVGGG